MSVKLPGRVVMKFCYCPPGSFKMGSPPDENGRRGNEDQVMVKLSKGFWLARTECTQAQWVAVMGANPSNFKGDDPPVERVSWNDAQKFITKLNEAKTLPAGWKAALPTEAQWEYACRAGTKKTFSFGKTLTAKQANFAYAVGKTCAVASYPANAWGLHDMHGNVLEWCEDWKGDKLSGGTDPTGVTSGSGRVCRGGDWGNDAFDCRVAARRDINPGDAADFIGFRVALTSVP
jgi:formylglycine-generating enzyme required for sulfatase activity